MKLVHLQILSNKLVNCLGKSQNSFGVNQARYTATTSECAEVPALYVSPPQGGRGKSFHMHVSRTRRDDTVKLTLESETKEAH